MKVIAILTHPKLALLDLTLLAYPYLAYNNRYHDTPQPTHVTPFSPSPPSSPPASSLSLLPFPLSTPLTTPLYSPFVLTHFSPTSGPPLSFYPTLILSYSHFILLSFYPTVPLTYSLCNLLSLQPTLTSTYSLCNLFSL